MARQSQAARKTEKNPTRTYNDFRQHIEALDKAGLL